MCNLVTIPANENAWLIHFMNGSVPDWVEANPPHMVYSYARPIVPIILADHKLVPASWTYMPPLPDGLTKEEKAKMGWMVQTFNSKGEELFEKRTWKEPAKERRALLPVVAYHEHQHRGKARVPYRFHKADNGVFLLAALWKYYENENLYRFSILTKTPNRLNRWVHNSNPRQPVHIPPEQMDIYLKGTAMDSIEPFLVPDENDGIVAEIGVGLNGLAPESLPPEPPRDDDPKSGELDF